MLIQEHYVNIVKGVCLMNPLNPLSMIREAFYRTATGGTAWSKEYFVDQIVSAIKADDNARARIEYDSEYWAGIKKTLMDVDDAILRKHYAGSVGRGSRMAIIAAALALATAYPSGLAVLVPLILAMPSTYKYLEKDTIFDIEFAEKFDRVLKEHIQSRNAGSAPSPTIALGN